MRKRRQSMCMVSTKKSKYCQVVSPSGPKLRDMRLRIRLVKDKARTILYYSLFIASSNSLHSLTGSSIFNPISLTFSLCYKCPSLPFLSKGSEEVLALQKHLISPVGYIETGLPLFPGGKRTAH